MSQDGTIELILKENLKDPPVSLFQTLIYRPHRPASLAMHLKSVSPNQDTNVLTPDHGYTQNLPPHTFFLGLFLSVIQECLILRSLETDVMMITVISPINFPVILT